MQRLLWLALLPLAAQGQQAVYRCEQNGKVGYSHEPCVGAKVIDATPTQGVNKMTGVTRKGAEVQREEHRKLLDDGFRPLTGMSHEQMDVERRRFRLSSAEKLQCRSSDLQLPELESRAAAANREMRFRAEAELYKARQEFYWLKC